VWAAVHGGTPIDFTEGETVTGAPNSIWVSVGGGGSSWARWSEARWLGVEEIEGEEGGPAASRAASGEWLITWRGGLRGTAWRGGWRRALARSCHAGRTVWGGGSGSRQGVRSAEAVAGRASAV
jgi:hypothetical protein